MALPSIADSLLVPMNLQAAVVNDPVLAGIAFVDGAYDYTKLSTFQTPAPAPFSDGGTKPKKGIHLHWELPAAFRNGTQATEDSQPEYPLVPNRWLISRYWPGHSTAKRQVKSWVLLSDAFGTDLDPDTSNSYVAPYGPDQGKATRIGKVVPLSEFTEPGGQTFLQAVAPGNTAFAAYRPNVENVFSFCDDGTDNAGNPVLTGPNDTVVFSYVVIGWFSDPGKDPLHGLSTTAEWAAEMGALAWVTNPFPFEMAGASPPQKAFGLKGYGDISAQFPKGQTLTVAGSTDNDGSYVIAADPVYDETDDHLTIPVEKAMSSATADGFVVPPGAPASWPTQTLTHGLMYNLTWQNTDMPPRPNSSPQEIAKNVKLSVGNSSVDALAAMIVAEAVQAEGESQAQAAADAQALEAFQTDLLNVLDKPGGQAQLDMSLRKEWFANENGGTFWSMVANTSVDSTATPNAAQETWLADINYFQQGHDRELRLLTSMQERLYMSWWRVQRINTGYVPPNLALLWSRIEDSVTSALPEEAAAVKAQQAMVQAWADKITALVGAPPSYTQGDVTIGIQTPAKPTPPQALELKASRMDRFFKADDPVLLISGLGASHSQNGPTQQGQGAARCRLGADHISALTVGEEAISLDSLASLAAVPSASALPQLVQDGASVLGIEALVLDPDNADLIATAATANASAIAGAIRAGTDFKGQAPQTWAAVPWLQAWIPLYLDWKVTYYPTVTAPETTAGNGDQWSFDRGNWAFNGIDYGWTGGDVTTPFTGPAASGQAITAASSANKTITLGGAGNLAFSFVTGAKFTVSGSTALNGSYTVASATTQGEDYVLTVEEAVPSDTGDGQAVLQVLSGGDITFGGRTFLTPQATFNFRKRLQQFIKTQAQAGKDNPALDDAAHLLDIIGGARYDIQSASASQKAFVITSTVDLEHLFEADSTCYVVEAKVNDGTFTVASTSFDEAQGLFTVVVKEAVTDAGIDGILVPEPSEWDLLSQSLSGFSGQLIMESLDPNAMAQGAVASGAAQGSTYDALVGDIPQDIPDLSLGDSVDAAQGTPTPYFFPVRGGFLAFYDLALIDRFGQKINLLYANNNAQVSDPGKLWQTFSPIRSRWLMTAPDTKVSNPQRLLRLPPRLGSGSRLDLRLVSAPDKAGGPLPDGVDIDLLGGANPVCGWLLPNHLDEGLLIYNAAGDALGELALSHRAGGVLDVVWFPTPEAQTPITDPTNPETGIPNQYMRGFVAGILNQPPATRGQAFANFLSSVDETLWAVDPLGGRTDQSLSVLVGRPLGLVRARVKLSAQGEVPRDESTQYAPIYPLPITGADAATGTITVTSSFDYTSMGEAQPGNTIEITGGTTIDGNYTITGTGFDGSSMTFTVLEPLPGDASSGSVVLPAPTGTITTTPFDLRLGRADLYEDGLIGYFDDTAFETFNAIHTVTDAPSAGYLKPVGPGNYLSVTAFAERSAPPPAQDPVPVPEPGAHFVTMIVDPRAGVHATTGVLPTQVLTLPPKFYEGPLAALELSFRAGPIIVDTEAIRMPRPTEQSGTWSWVQHNSPGNDSSDWQEDPISPVADQARVPRMPQELRDGWMKLTSHDFNSDD